MHRINFRFRHRRIRMQDNSTLESIIICRFQSMQLVMYIDPPLAVRTYPYFILPQRRAVTPFHIAENRFGNRTVLTVSMRTQTGIFDRIPPSYPIQRTAFFPNAGWNLPGSSSSYYIRFSNNKPLPPALFHASAVRFQQVRQFWRQYISRTPSTPLPGE